MSAAQRSGLFIAVEGGDGAGKSTQIRLLSRWLEAQDVTFLVTREPGGTPLGRQLREVVLHGDHVTPKAEALLYAADRAHHVATVVRPALERGEVVLTDRYIDSSVAYQGGARGLGSTSVREISRWATDGLLPDLVVLLDVPPETGHARRHQKAGHVEDRIEAESAAFHREVRERFLLQSVAEPERYLVIDAGAAPEQIHQDIRAEVQRRWGRGA